MEENIINIEISNITKTYKNGVKGLDDITFSVGQGVFGLLGHNGAGKTTLMKLITTILSPTSGTIKVLGNDTRKKGQEIRQCIGYLPQEITMYPNLTVYEFVDYMAQLKGFNERKMIEDTLEKVDMMNLRKRKISQLSGGMKRRVGIAQAIVGNPSILIVDEPTSGLDPEERVRFRGVLSKYAQGGKTVLLSTHIVEDVYHLCEYIAVLRQGKLYFEGHSNDLINVVHNKIKVLQLTNEEELVQVQKNTVIISTTYENDGIIARVMDNDNIYKITSVQESLEDAYVYCMGGKSCIM